MELLNQLFGIGKDITVIQMSARAFVFFFITIIYLRIAGIRTFGKKSSIDMTIVIVLGSVVARGIAGVSGFGATLAASFVLVLIHRLISWLSYKSEAVEKILKGERVLLYENGFFNQKNMERTGISKHDFNESLRIATQQEGYEKIKAAYLETNGQLSFIMEEGEI